MTFAIEWAGAVGACDVCLRPLADDPGFADAEVPGRAGAWGLLCSACVRATGASIAWGRGQRYQRASSGSWLLVEGGPPLSD